MTNILATKDADHGQEVPPQSLAPGTYLLGCDRYCPSDSLACGNGADRTMHPSESLGDDWYEWGDWGDSINSQIIARSSDAPANNQ